MLISPPRFSVDSIVLSMASTAAEASFFPRLASDATWSTNSDFVMTPPSRSCGVSEPNKPGGHSAFRPVPNRPGGGGIPALSGFPAYRRLSRDNVRVPLHRIAWITTVLACLITAALLLLGGYQGYAAVAVAV